VIPTADLAQVWIVDVGGLSREDIARCQGVLANEERQQTERFVFDEDRNAYRAAHALLRMALSAFEPAVPPRQWAFESTPYGRPEIASGRDLPRLRFNISHTRGLVACVVTRAIDCGIDVEAIDRFGGLGHLVPSILSPAEQARWMASPEPDRPLLLSRFWTMKEAYAKALGLGMSLPFPEIDFEFTAGGAHLANGVDWQFEHWFPAPNYIAALALRSAAPVRVTRCLSLPEAFAGTSS
jgi:4'-phosphopantetheinyl transferase